MKRALALSKMRTAGYHDDNRGFTRLLITTRVSHAVAQQQWTIGRQLRAAGVRCDCHECRERAAEVRT